MDRELEEQIDDIIHKATKDLKTRVVRVITRHITKTLKEQAREFRTGCDVKNTSKVSSDKVRITSSSGGTKNTSSLKNKKSTKNTKYYSDSDSDYYSE
jgi:hypothetical protein